MRSHEKIPFVIAVPVLAGLSLFTGCFRVRPAVRGVTAEQWRAEMESRRGSIVVVSVWATWCRECVDGFPGFVELQPRYRDRGVQFLTLSLDETGPAKDVSAVESFLRMQATGMPNLILLVPLADSLDMLGIGGVPAVLVYRPDGSVRYRLEPGEFDDAVDPSDVEAAIQSLIPEPLPETGQ